MNIKIASVDSVILYFGENIDLKTASKVRFAYKNLKENPVKGIKEIIPAYVSLLIKYDIFIFSFDELSNLLKERLKDIKTENETIGKLIEIPTLYSKEVGFDFDKFANLSQDEVINLHTSKEYFVYAVGFLPGFAYMGAVDFRLKVPRLQTPRAKVPKGSVGIADTQTAIYPRLSPGGWNIIGRVALELFSEEFDGFSFLKVGDRVRFKSVCKDEFLSLGGILWAVLLF